MPYCFPAILKKCTVILSIKFPRNSACNYMLENIFVYFFIESKFIYTHKIYKFIKAWYIYVNFCWNLTSKFHVDYILYFVLILKDCISGLNKEIVSKSHYFQLLNEIHENMKRNEDWWEEIKINEASHLFPPSHVSKYTSENWKAL